MGVAFRLQAPHGFLGPISRDKADHLLLLAACLMVLLPHASHLPPWTSVTSLMLMTWRAWIVFRGNRMPARWILIPLAIAAMAGVYATHKTFVGRDAGVTMLVLLLTFKLLEMRGRRDLFVIVFLNFFLMLTSFFYSQGIGSALLIMGAVVAMLTVQVSFQYTGTVPPLRQRLKLGGTIFVMAAPLMMVLFFLFPRVQGPLWGMPGDAQGARTGLSETMTPGNIARLATSDDIAFRVQFLDPPPPNEKRYWRALVLGGYDGRTWGPLRARHTVGPVVLRPEGKPIRHRITLEPHSQHWLFALETPASPPGIPGNPTRIDPLLQLVAAHPITDRVRYEATSYADFRLQSDADPIALQEWLDLPPGYNPRTLEFAAALRSRSDDNTAMVTLVLDYFRQQPFSYTLDAPLLGRDSVDEFLFTTRAGFCEHYSSAFVVLMRALDIPARVVTGYQGGTINPVDGFMTIRQSDAHAWAEVWLQGRGWVRVDPTAAVAPDRIVRNLDSVLPRRFFGGLMAFGGQDSTLSSALQGLRQRWDAVANGWNQWVLNYTPDKQKSLLQSIGFPDPDWRTLGILMTLLGTAAVALALAPLMSARNKLDPLDTLYDKLCARLEKAGLPRQSHEGPRTYRRRIVGSAPRLSDDTREAASQFLKLYEAARYRDDGNTGPLATDTISTLKHLLAQCR